MKFPKLRWLPTISVLFLSGFHFLFSQVLSPPTLSSTHGNGPVISVCDSETVTFTATGDLGPTANDAEFRIIRAGVILYPLGAPGPQSILSFSSSSLQNGDLSLLLFGPMIMAPQEGLVQRRTPLQFPLIKNLPKNFL